MNGTLGRCLQLVRAARGQQGDELAATLAELEQAVELAQAGPRDRAAAAAGLPVITLDLVGYVTGWNAGAEALFGYTCEEALGRHVLFLYADGEADGEVAELFLGQGESVIEVRRRRKNGDLVWVRLALSLVTDPSGEATGMRVGLSPLPEQLTDEEKILLHARIIEDTDQGVLITDAQERIVSINSAFTRITGYTASEAIGQTPDLLRSGVHDAEFRARVRAAMRGAHAFRGEIVGKRKNGELFPQSVTISVVRNAEGEITHAFSIFSDISVHKDAELRMQRLANYDALTGLPNRNLLGSLMSHRLAEANASGEHGALMVVEVDRIGAISDTLGHEVACELVQALANLFKGALRDEDVLARLDGSKFAIVLSRIEKREHAAIVAQKLLASLAVPIRLAAHTLQVSASIGIAAWPDDSREITSLMRFAEVAQARGAQAGANTFLFYREEMDRRARQRIRLESELRSALDAGQLQLYYQPKVNLRNGRIVGAEALVRWNHPEHGMVAPDVFIPVAEETDLILDLGGWVIEEACRQVRAWNDAGLQMPPIAVNLSARQFDRRLPARLLAVLDRHGVLPGQLMLEITESLLVRGSDAVVAIMDELVAMGFSLALDDFGTGYSSLAYLKKFPISTLKIDRAFVTGLPNEASDCAIARAIVTMAQQLRQEIVAEGVESAAQMAFLRELGCDQLQGHLFSPAVPAAEFEALLKDGRRLPVTPQAAA